MLIQSLALDASFSGVLAWCSQVTPGAVMLCPGRTQEARGSLELHNGGLRALGEAWSTSSRLRHFPIKSGRFSVSTGGLRALEIGCWRQEEAERRGAAGKPSKEEKECSTSYPGGNQVDGLPPASHST